jgi:hypothetical protein
MKRHAVTRAALLGVATLTAAALASRASAAVIETIDGTPLTFMLHNETEADGDTQLLHAQPGNAPFEVLSDETLHNNGDTNGFAQVLGGGGGNGVGFDYITLMPLAPIVGMNEIKFKIELDPSLIIPGGGGTVPNGYQTNFTFQTQVCFVAGPCAAATPNPIAWSDPGRYLVLQVAPDAAIKSVKLYDLVGTSTKHNQPDIVNQYNFSDIKQISFDAVSVPEPAAWALMILGFGLTGGMLRARRALKAA